METTQTFSKNQPEMASGKKVKRILVPTDFSETSHNAFEYAIHMAEDMDASIVVLHTFQQIPAEASHLPPRVFEEIKAERMEAASKHFREYQREAALEIGKKIQVDSLLVKGNAAEKIIEFSKSGYYDMVVMGTQGIASSISKAFGSVTSKVIREASVPVLAVPVEVAYKPIEHIMYAMSFEEQDFQVLDALIEIAESLDSRISCLHVRNMKSGWDQIDLNLFERLNDMCSGGDPLSFYISNHTDVVQGLQEYIAGNKVDMVVMLTHKRNILDQLQHASVTRQMALYTDLPLLTFHDR